MSDFKVDTIIDLHNIRKSTSEITIYKALIEDHIADHMQMMTENIMEMIVESDYLLKEDQITICLLIDKQ